MKFQAQIYNKRKQRQVEVTVHWTIGIFESKPRITSIQYRDCNIQRHVPIRDLEALQAEIERQAINLTHKERINAFIFK